VQQTKVTDRLKETKDMQQKTARSSPRINGIGQSNQAVLSQAEEPKATPID